jgi:hypothetical protein
MRRPVLLAVAATLASVLAGAAPASATTCDLLVDQVGDGGVTVAPTLAHSDQLDIVSGDVASGATTVVGVLRLRSLAPDPLTTYTAVTWSLGFTLGATRYSFTARRGVTSTTYTGRLTSDDPARFETTTPALTVDVANATLTWTAPRTAFPELAVAGATFDQLHAGSGAAGFNADAAATASTYVDQSPSCVAAA